MADNFMEGSTSAMHQIALQRALARGQEGEKSVMLKPRAGYSGKDLKIYDALRGAEGDAYDSPLNFLNTSKYLEEGMVGTFTTSTFPIRFTADISSSLKGVFASDTPGSFVDVKRPIRFTVIEGTDLTSVTLPKMTTGSVRIQVQEPLNVLVTIGFQEMTLFVKDISKKFDEAVKSLSASLVDRFLNTLQYGVSNYVISATDKHEKAINDATTLLMVDGTPNPNMATSDFLLIHSSESFSTIISDASNRRNQELTTRALSGGGLGMGGSDMPKYFGYTSLNMETKLDNHTYGVWGASPLIDGASQGSSYRTNNGNITQTLNVKGLTISTTGAVKRGDAFTIAGITMVTPLEHKVKNILRTFVVTADADSDGSGNATITITSPIYALDATSSDDRPFANVNTAPADSAVITLMGTKGGTYSETLAYWKQCIGYGCIDLYSPQESQKLVKTVLANAGQGSEANAKIGIYAQSDIKAFADLFRVSFIPFLGMLEPMHGVRIRSPEVLSNFAQSADQFDSYYKSNKSFNSIDKTHNDYIEAKNRVRGLANQKYYDVYAETQNEEKANKAMADVITDHSAELVSIGKTFDTVIKESKPPNK